MLRVHSLGLPSGNLAQGEYLKRLHPDDAIASRESLALAVKNRNENWYCEYRSTHPQKGPRRISGERVKLSTILKATERKRFVSPKT